MLSKQVFLLVNIGNYSGKRTNLILFRKKLEVFQHANSLMQGAHNEVSRHKVADGIEMET
jgi:hypothetical protein